MVKKAIEKTKYIKPKITLMLTLAVLFEVMLIDSCTEKHEPATSTVKLEKDLVLEGSDSEYELVKRILTDFSAEQPEITFSIKGGGSGKGINSLIYGKANIATSSRQFNEKEYRDATDKNIHPVPLIFALDAVAFITHPQSGIDSLSPEQLRKIYCGEVSNWKELGGADKKIRLVSRNELSGTHDYVAERLHLENWHSEIMELEHNKDIYEKVKSTPGAIGYVSLGTLVSTLGKPVTDVWAVNVYTDYSSSISPYELNKVQNGDYYFSRPLYLYFNGVPDGKLKTFADYIQSNVVQESLWLGGYFPITDQHKKLNGKNNFTQ